MEWNSIVFYSFFPYASLRLTARSFASIFFGWPFSTRSAVSGRTRRKKKEKIVVRSTSSTLCTVCSSSAVSGKMGRKKREEKKSCTVLAVYHVLCGVYTTQRTVRAYTYSSRSAVPFEKVRIERKRRKYMCRYRMLCICVRTVCV